MARDLQILLTRHQSINERCAGRIALQTPWLSTFGGSTEGALFVASPPRPIPLCPRAGANKSKLKCWASQAACMCRCDAAEKRHKARKPAGRAHGFVRMRCIHTYVHRCCRRYERAGFSHFEDDGWALFTHSANSGNCHVHDFAEPTYIHTSKYLRGPYVCTCTIMLLRTCTYVRKYSVHVSLHRNRSVCLDQKET